MGFANNLMRAVVGLPIPKPTVPKPPRSLGVRIVLGTVDVFLGGATTKPKIWRHDLNDKPDGVNPCDRW